MWREGPYAWSNTHLWPLEQVEELHALANGSMAGMLNVLGLDAKVDWPIDIERRKG